MDQYELPNTDPNIAKDIDDNSNEMSVNVVSESHSEVNDTKPEAVDEVEVIQQHTVNTDEQPVTEITKPAILLIPSLKGKMTYENGQVKCKGVWGMSDSDHDIPGRTSDFEFKLVVRDDDSPIFPVNGKYQGWFHLKQALPLKGSLKIEDKELLIKFLPVEEEEGKYSINGHGFNKFGSFTLKGTLSSEGDIHLYREYYNLTIPPVVHSKRRLSGTFTDEPSKKTAKAAIATISVDTTNIEPIPNAPVISPREGSGRIRKQSSIMKEYQDTSIVKLQPSTVKEPKTLQLLSTTNKTIAPPTLLSSSLIRQDSSGIVDRAQRLSQPMKKCTEVLKEMSKNPLGIWFLEPVDYLKLNLPDYPVIITKPMDFTTIRGKIESGAYEKPDNFAEDMRLIFRNAITFNTSKDNAVHIAARELSNKFESRYRVLISQLNGEEVYSSGAVLALEATKSPRLSVGGVSSNKSTSKTSTKTSRTSFESSSQIIRSTSSNIKSSSSIKNNHISGGAGPRTSSSNHPFFPSAVAALDGGSSQLLEMQRVMQAMQEEINSLKTVVRENDIVKKLQETKEAAHNPLTLKEKRTLIDEINKLPSHKMEAVLMIIQSALPADENGKETDDGDMEVPLDMLDTFTLRKLQKYIEENTFEKKKSSLQRQSISNSIGNKETGVKRPRKQKEFSSNADLLQVNTAFASDQSINNNELGLFADDENALLFETDSFEELRAQNNSSNSIENHHSNNINNHEKEVENMNDNENNDDDKSNDITNKQPEELFHEPQSYENDESQPIESFPEN